MTLMMAVITLGALSARAQQPDALARFEEEQLERRSYQQLVVQACELEPLTAMPTASQPLTEFETASLERWGVFEGGGAQLDAYSFAERVGDHVSLAQLEQQARKARTGGWLATGLGALAMGGGATLVAQSAQQQDAPPALSATGAGLSLAGLVATAAGLRIAIAPRRLHGEVDATWLPTQADELIEAHNRKLREELGLPPE